MLIFTDVLIALTPEGEELVLLDDSDPLSKKRLFDAYDNRCVTPEILGNTQGTICQFN